MTKGTVGRTLAARCALIACIGCSRRLTEDLAFQAPKGWEGDQFGELGRDVIPRRRDVK
jgi:hypothetical protein